MLSAAIMVACSDSEDTPAVKPAETFPVYTQEYVEPQVEPFHFTAKEHDMYKNMNKAGMAMFKSMCAANPSTENMLMSPFGASVALSMLANNLTVEGQEAVLKAFGADNIDELNTMFKKLMRDQPYEVYYDEEKRSAEYQVANALWYSEKRTLNERFSKVLPDYYTASIFKADFSQSSQVVNDINSWTSDKTKGLISCFIDRLDKLTEAVLVNTLYYSARWSIPFEDTYKTDFKGIDGNKTVDMMKCKVYTDGTYAQNTVAEIVTKDMHPFVFTIVLPKEGVTVNQLIAECDFASLLTLPREERTLVELEFPKFEFANSELLNYSEVLNDMGIHSLSCKIFDDNNPWACSMLQKSKIIVDEEHVAGASATVVEMTSGIPMKPEKTAKVKVDRPFVFFVRTMMEDSDGLTNPGEIVQAGKIVKL